MIADNHQFSVLVAAESSQAAQNAYDMLSMAGSLNALGVVIGEQIIIRTRLDEPGIVVVVENETENFALNVCRRVKDARPATAVVVWNRSDGFSTSYLRAAFDAGASNVVTEVEPMATLSRKITQAARDLPRSTVGRLKRNEVITVYSAKGGVGRSFIAANLAALIASARHEVEVTLIDLNLQFGTLRQFLGLSQPSRTIYDLVRIISELDLAKANDALQRKPLADNSQLRLLPVPNDPFQADEVTGAHVRQILSVLSRGSITLIDTTATISDVTLAALELSTRILYVCTPDVIAVNQALRTLEFFANLGISVRDRVDVFINKVAPYSEVQPKELRSVFHRAGVARIAGYAELEGEALEPYLTGRLLAQEVASRRPKMWNSLASLAENLTLVGAKVDGAL